MSMSTHALFIRALHQSKIAQGKSIALPVTFNITTFALAVVLMFGCFASVFAQHYQQTNLVSDIPGLAPVTDPNLVNPWGLAVAQPTFLWVADNETGVSTLYDGSGHPGGFPGQPPLVVIIPPAGGGTIAAPTGTVFNGTGEFPVSNGSVSGSSLFIFASEDGGISGWSPTVDVTHAILA